MNKKLNKMNYQNFKPRMAWSIVLFITMGFCNMALSQLPTVTARFANPQYNCVNGQYCLDVEFQSDTDGVEIFGVNVRFFIDGEMMELASFTDYQGGYGPVAPDPPDVITSGPGIGNSLFGFGDPGTGIADFVNGAIQLLDDSQPAILLSSASWSKLFQICFTIEDPDIDSTNFCPPVVWDLEQDPANDGFLIGDDGVVITLTDPDPMVMSQPSNENVVQFNWQYVGMGAPPYGEPVELECISLECVPTIVCAPDITILCDESIEPENTGESTAEEICMAEIIITYSDVTMEGSCDQAYSISRRWIATNECGLADTCFQVITIIDTIPPGLVCPPTITIECDDSQDPLDTGLATATDSCDPSPVVTYADVTAEGACLHAFTITRTWTATDDCGNSTACEQTIIVVDITAPGITCPPNITIECDESSLPDITGTATATDACDPAPMVEYLDISVSGTCPIFVNRLWTATDACGNISQCVQFITIDDTTGPDITCPADMTIECTDSPLPVNTGFASATDNCDSAPAVTYSDVSFADPICPQGYSITRTWIATDVCGNSTSCFQEILVVDSTPPDIVCPPDATIECTDSTSPDLTGSATATDNCTDESDIFISSSDVTVGGGGCPQEYTIMRTWVALDECGNSSSCTQMIVIDDTTPPLIFCPQDMTIECTESTLPDNTGTATASDLCDPSPSVSFSDTPLMGSCPEVIQRTWTATDACGNTNTCIQLISLDDTTPPSITCPAGVTVACTSMVPAPAPGSVTTSDVCGTATVTHGGDVVSDSTCINRYTITRTYISTDECDNSAICTQVIVVNDVTAPMLTCPANATFSCASLVPAVNPASVTTTDNCGGMVTVTHDGDVITNQTCADRFTLTRTYRATDACGNSATCAQVITVFDGTPPMVTCPPNQTIEFGDDESPANTGSPTVTDNCGGTPQMTFNDVIIDGACDEEYTILRTWTITDVCGNTSTCLQTIEVDGQCVVDLSLTKVLIGGGVVVGGDNVSFNITVFNEGEVSVSSVTITDYIPIGFTLNDPSWTAGNAGSTGQSASRILSIANGGLDANGLNPGESVTVSITLLANANIAAGLYINTAEISVVLNMNGENISGDDVDSTPDQDDTNDPPGEDDIDSAEICVLPMPVITGDGYVCPGEITVYTVSGFNPDFTYIWSLNGGGQIVADNGSSISVEWQGMGGGPFQISVTVILGGNCQITAFFNVYVQGFDAIACNDHINLSLDHNCEAVVLSGMLLEGEAEGNNNYFVIVRDQNGNIIPNATLGPQHVGQILVVTVVNECNGQSCWGTILVEDKIPPVIECTDVTVACGSSLDPVFTPPLTGSAVGTVTPGLPIGPNAGTITNASVILNVPANAVVTDVDVQIDLDHTWSADLNVVLISPAGTTVLLANAVCGSADNWDNVIFDDDAGILVTNACNLTPPPALAGTVRPQQMLAPINGESAVGTWTVRITDQVGGDGGTLHLVSVIVDYYLAVPSAPAASDACGEVDLTYTDSQTGDPCEVSILTRSWTATDGSGNTATCTQVITILPLTLDNVDFPPAYEGLCGESVSPNFTGWPSVNGEPITDQSNLCNIFVGYWDKELNECGGGRKIVRTWTVLDWCNVEVVEAIQVIKLADMVGPVLTCPQNIQVGTDFWYCYANVSVPRPQAVDACSEVVSYSLSSTGGTVVSFGNNYVIQQLGLGTHTVTWTVADECGNSSTCSFLITVVDDVVPVAICDEHTIVSLTNDGPFGVTLVPASVFDDGSYDNCGPVTFRARRIHSLDTPPQTSPCINFDWTTEGACIDDTPGGIPPVNSRDQGTVHRPCVPFACCDVDNGPIMVELEVRDAAGNLNFCMVEVIVQDKISPFVACPPDIIVSCDFWFNVQEGLIVDAAGNNNGALDEDPLSAVFGNMYDAFRYNESVRQNIVINDPGNPTIGQPHVWGIDGWADDNCEVNLSVRVIVTDDCSGGDLPANAPPGAVKLIERRFSASDGNQGIAPGTCTQRIWVVDFDPFTITDTQCGLVNADDVRWPCDILLTNCPDGGLTPEDLEQILPANLRINARPVLNDDACSLIGVTYEDSRFDFVDGACFKILRRWAVIDWCQYNSQTGFGLWYYTQVIKVHDEQGPVFVAPCVDVVLCVADDGVSLPDNNQAFLGESNPLASSCSVHLNLSRTVLETCSDIVHYDVKIYPFNGTEFILIKATTTVPVDENNNAVLSFNTRESSNQSVRLNGLPYNSPFCGDYHRILWSVEDGCGNWSHCEYLFRLEDCKQPSPVCINGLSTVVMPVGGQVTIWAKDFNASSFDDCTPADELLYSFSGTMYQPSFTYDCDNIPAFNTQLPVEIWVADGGTDDNCNGQISWNERNKDFCLTTIVITDNMNVCGGSGSILAGEILTEFTDAVAEVNVTLTSPGQFFPSFVTAQNGRYVFPIVPQHNDYTITPERNDQHRNGVSTLDLVRIQRHLLGQDVFTSPYQYIAADANSSNSVSAIDLVEIRKLILGIYTEFPLNKSWRFVEKGFEMNPANPWPFNENIEILDLDVDSSMHNDFVGVKIGDVNNTAKANLHQVLPRNGQRVMSVRMEAAEHVEAGDVVDVMFILPEVVEGFQWTLETRGLRFEQVGSETMKIHDHHVGLLRDGIITMSWHQEGGIEEVTSQSIQMRFTATASGSMADLIRLTSRVTEAEAYTLSGEILDVQLAHSTVAPEFALYQNQPNPWNEQTSIGFELPEDGAVEFTVFDVTGKVIKSINGEYSAGYNTIILSVLDLPATGVMYYRLESGEYTASKKMVLMK